MWIEIVKAAVVIFALYLAFKLIVFLLALAIRALEYRNLKNGR